MKKYIHIHYDYAPEFVQLKSYLETKKLVNDGQVGVDTLCTGFFSFKYLDLGYEVMVRVANGNYISLSEALKNERAYTKRNIRLGHDMEKLLLSGEFDEYLFG